MSLFDYHVPNAPGLTGMATTMSKFGAIMRPEHPVSGQS
jgi:hypothetical protein